jgi:hypothetical protein
MKKPMDKRTKRDDSPWGDDSFEGRKKKSLKSSKTAKRYRVQDLSFDDEY